MKVWVHRSTHTDALLDGGGFPVALGNIPEVTFANGSTSPARRVPSAKVTIWADKEAAMAFMRKSFKGCELRDLGNRIEVDLPEKDSLLPARTLYMVEVDI